MVIIKNPLTVVQQAGGGGGLQDGYGSILYNDGSVGEILKIQNSTELNSLCNWNGTSTISIGGKTINPANIQGVFVGNEVTDLPNNFCYGFSGLVSLLLPDGLTTIGQNCFSYLSTFNSPLVLPDTVTTIGKSSFSHLDSFNSPITLPADLTTGGLAMHCFYYMPNMTNIIYLGDLPTTVLPSNSARIFATGSSTDPCYTTGITISGTYASDWTTALPDNDSAPNYRKLIIDS